MNKLYLYTASKLWKATIQAAVTDQSQIIFTNLLLKREKIV